MKLLSIALLITDKWKDHHDTG